MSKACNLLSVRSLIAHGYSVLFDDNAGVITAQGMRHKGASQHDCKQNVFIVADVESFSLATSTKDDLKLWHFRYAHINIKGFKLLSDKGTIVGLHKIGSLNLCEGCIFGKQNRKFLLEKH